ncbi:hypothetical protein [Streptomyces olivochromogenes]|uniref:Uncharacterized protein n=1 Tax=Streptomyces olivochromogenes TaxID=1963 RepID=A0A250VSY2_STROL|nr:hypothetical protein [Streptomyces olivochromogenes]KUN38243.1 hypothetical protein AQJ27_44890 [Streptomyces olivochromogenes]GAX57317.1 hypothetical protein SO3561_08887 [Streptomyces olivochromogenes]
MLIPATSTEYVHVPVTAPAGVDITGTPPKLAFLPVSNRDNPVTSDWQTGTWANGTEARLLIGPDGGALTLAAGDYRVYVSFDPPGSENIVRLSGYLGIT